MIPSTDHLRGRVLAACRALLRFEHHGDPRDAALLTGHLRDAVAEGDRVTTASIIDTARRGLRLAPLAPEVPSDLAARIVELHDKVLVAIDDGDGAQARSLTAEIYEALLDDARQQHGRPIAQVLRLAVAKLTPAANPETSPETEGEG